MAGLGVRATSVEKSKCYLWHKPGLSELRSPRVNASFVLQLSVTWGSITPEVFLFSFWVCQMVRIKVMLDRSYETFRHPTCKRFKERMLFNCAYCFYLTFMLNIYILHSFLNMLTLRFYSLAGLSMIECPVKVTLTLHYITVQRRECAALHRIQTP